MKLCGFEAGLDQPFFLIAGTCVIESHQMALDTAGTLKEITDALGIHLIYKSSFDKANRTSATSFRGPGLEQGLAILARVKKETGLPVTTDFHTPDQAGRLAEVVDLLQVPAMLSRQTDMLIAAAKTHRAVNIKKGQFLAPWDVASAIAKVKDAGNDDVMVTEPGATFGYGNAAYRYAPRHAGIVWDDHGAAAHGGLSTAEVQRVVRASFDRMRRCYGSEGYSDHTATGRLAVKFVIDREGGVTFAHVSDITRTDAAVGTCLRRTYEGLTFPRPEAGIVTVAYPIEFRWSRV